MYSSPEEIKAAIDAYRSHIATHNRHVLEVYIQVLESAELDEHTLDGEDINDIRIDGLTSLFSDEIKDYISVPTDIFKHYDDLVSKYGLDGTWVIKPDTAVDDYALRRDEYFSIIERALKEKSLEEVRETITFPEEFRILAQHVYSLSGPGLTDEVKSIYQASFWDGVVYGPDGAEGAITDLVESPEEVEQLFPPGWEVAGGWRPGGGRRNGFWVAYCRRPTPPGQEPEPWAWRYVCVSMYERFTVWDTIPELLADYCTYRENPVPERDDIDERSLLDGIWY